MYCSSSACQGQLATCAQAYYDYMPHCPLQRRQNALSQGNAAEQHGVVGSSEAGLQLELAMGGWGRWLQRQTSLHQFLAS